MTVVCRSTLCRVYQLPESVDRGISKEEIHTMMNTEMPDKTHELVRDLFLFSVFTGWHIPMSRTSPPTTCKLFDGNLWIITRRKKTNTESNIRLLDVPRKIIEKYKGWQRTIRFSPCQVIRPATKAESHSRFVRYKDTFNISCRKTFGSNYHTVIQRSTH